MSAPSLPLPPAPASGTVAILRQQAGIGRSPTRLQSNEPRESMNCKSCRKRKIKCNRMRPSCKACQVFQCQCVYDAVPKKRGPKTDVLEALLKRVDGLEAKLKEKNKEGQTPKVIDAASTKVVEEHARNSTRPASKRVVAEISQCSDTDHLVAVRASQIVPKGSSAALVEADELLHTYFARFHGRPYYILDESTVRDRIRMKKLPDYVLYAIWAVASRHTLHPRGTQVALELGHEYAMRSRRCIDTDEPSIDSLQALLLLVMAFMALGQGKKAYLLMASAIGMAMALELHREVGAQHQVDQVERELRRRLFWTCYLFDRFMICGSRRASLICDDSIALRLPSWCLSSSSATVLGDFFQQGSNLQYCQGSGKIFQGTAGMLIDVTRILGITNAYLAAGGVKGDSHFPWHSLSRLSKIRQELDCWASGAGPVFSGLDALFQKTEATTLFLSKIIYHLIHCLVYRPFLPIDLMELAGNGQHQSWQIEATNICFLHANAIGELTAAANEAGTVEWPAIVGYCICTAATVHIHGAHYANTSAYGGDVNIFSNSSDLLSQGMSCLNELRFSWANIQHHIETLHHVYDAHKELVKTIGLGQMRYIPSFHHEDFFDRYANIGSPGSKAYHFDISHVSMSDVVTGSSTDRSSEPGESATAEQQGNKRKLASSQEEGPNIRPISGNEKAISRGPGVSTEGMRMSSQLNTTQPSALVVDSTQSYDSHIPRRQDAHTQATESFLEPVSSIHDYSLASMSTNLPTGQGVMSTSGTGYSSRYGYIAETDLNDTGLGYDPMFGILPTNALNSPSPWLSEEGQHYKTNALSGRIVPSLATKSNNTISGTGPAEEKDPFLSLLEQLAEDEHRFEGASLDFFFGKSQNDSEVSMHRPGDIS